MRVRKINYNLVTEACILDSEKCGAVPTFATFVMQPCRHSLLVVQTKYFLIVEQSCEVQAIVGHSDALSISDALKG